MQLTTASDKSAPLYDFSGTITTGGVAQNLLPIQKGRSYLLIQNLSTGPLSVEFGPARAVANLSSGTVSSVTITNAGVAYTYPPTVQFLGGIVGSIGFAVPGSNNPNNNNAPISPGTLAQATATISGGAVTAINISNPGSGYLYPPYIELMHDPRDPYGVAIPSATNGILLGTQYASIIFEATTCPTRQVSIWGATTGQAYCCKVVINGN
jgi:hypothetical protein